EDASSSKQGDPADDSIDDDSRWTSAAVNKSLDLVAHQGESAAEKLSQLGLPPGKITQIRLVLDTSLPERNVVTRASGGDCALDVSNVARKGIKINHPFKALSTT